MRKNPNEPHAFLMLCGFEDLYRISVGVHTADEIIPVLKEWGDDRRQKWPSIERHFGFNQSVGRIMFHSKGMRSESSIDGFILYGTSPFGLGVTKFELSNLGVRLAERFGQPFVELHIAGEVWGIQREMDMGQP